VAGARYRPTPGPGLIPAPVPAAVVWAARAAGLLLFVIVVVARGGPLSAQTDARAVTFPTTAVSHGQWRLAEQETLIPDPPGYPLLAAPVVTVLRPLVGSPVWCSSRPVPASLGGGSQAAYYRSLLHLCSSQQPARRALPPWYRSQAVLGVLAWLVLLAGVQLLLRAVHRRPTVAEVVAALGLAVLPFTGDALVESFHPQDLLSVGLGCAALAQCLRRRWVLSGLLFGAAVLSKQFAVLVLLAALVSAPSHRDRAKLGGSALAAVVAGIAPFWAADQAATWHALSGTYVAGVGIIRSATAVGLLGMAEGTKLAIARDGPVLLSALLCLALWWKARDRLSTPQAVIGLSLACLATRLVLEVSIYEYYFLAAAVFLFVLDLAAGRLPVCSTAWVLCTRYGLLSLASAARPGWTATGFLACAVAAFAVGLSALAPSAHRPVVERKRLLRSFSGGGPGLVPRG